MGLFIGASIVYVYDVSTYFILQIITKFKSRFGTGIRIEELKTESDEGQDEEMKMNNKTFPITQKTTSTSSIRTSYSENENIKILINIQEELAKQGDVLANLGNMLARQGNMLAMHDIIISNYHKKPKKF